MIARRHFVVGAAAMLAAPVRADPPGPPIGLQLYSVQGAIAGDFAGTLAHVAAMGYRRVETGLALAGRDAAQLRHVFDRFGLAWDSAHCSGDELREGLSRTIDRARTAGLAYIVCAFPLFPASFQDALKGPSLDDWKRNAALFNEIGEQTHKAGLQFAYHNHNLEFRRYGNVTGYDTLLGLTDPARVKLELDCGWMVSGGYDPAAYLERYPARYAMLHVKDLTRASIPNFSLEMTGTAVGRGIIDWKRLFAAARKAAIRASYVELEPPATSLAAAKASYDYLRRLN